MGHEDYQLYKQTYYRYPYNPKQSGDKGTHSNNRVGQQDCSCCEVIGQILCCCIIQ